MEIKIDFFHVYLNNKNHDLSIGKITHFPTSDVAMAQIKDDMETSVKWSGSSFDTISAEIKNTQGCFHNDIFYATLFVLEPEKFLPIKRLMANKVFSAFVTA